MYNTASLLVIALCLAALSTASVKAVAGSSVHPVNLRCEYLADPAGIDVAYPRLSWTLEASAANARGLKQSAYQIAVASAPGKSAKPDLWDSGKVASDRSLQVAYAGKPLASRQSCYWRVRSWDQGGRVSAWSPVATWRMGLLSPSDWSAKWIGTATDAKELPLFRKEFTVAKPLARAEVFICGLGAYELHMNGKPVGADLLEPGWTNYRKTCLYRAYDVTKQLKVGANAFGVMLGNGMYNVEGGRYVKFTGSFGKPKLIAQLHLDYADGSSKIVATDATWQAIAGPITFSCIYGGEDYDARREQAGWDAAGFVGTGCSSAVVTEGPGGKLIGSSQSAPPIRVANTLTPVKVYEAKPGVWVYDMGQNCSLMPRIALRGKAGATVRMTPGELLNKDGTVSQSSSGGPSYFSYTLKGTGKETWAPRFTYYGSRYIQVEGASPQAVADKPQVLSLEAMFVCSSAPQIGEFSCSNELFNRTSELIRWAIRSNMVSLFTDCPHRERLGWLEQTHLMGPSFMVTCDIPTLLTKMVGDMREAQLDDGLVPDIAPEYVVFGGGFRDSPEWGSAYIIVPWRMYEWYGDTSILRDNYDGMKRYVAYLGTKASGNIVSHGLGDWYDIGPGAPGYAQLTPIPLTATAFYYHDITVVERVARLLGHTDEAAIYAKLAAEVKDAFNREFYNAQTGSYAKGSQAGNAIPIVFGLCDPANTDRVVADIIRDVRERKDALTAGDVGYRYLLRALAQAGRSDVIFDMNCRSDRPGYGYQLAHGATSLTEAWDALASSSQNHFMLGHILEWFYADLAGIQCDPSVPAYKKIIIKPAIVGDVTWAKASYKSPSGDITSAWKRDGNTVTLDVVIPANTAATVYVPAKSDAGITEGGKPAAQSANVRFLRAEHGYAVYAVGSGRYTFVAKQ